MEMVVRWRGRWMKLSGWRGVEESTNERGDYEMKRRRGMRGFRLLKLQQIYIGIIEDLPL